MNKKSKKIKGSHQRKKTTLMKKMIILRKIHVTMKYFAQPFSTIERLDIFTLHLSIFYILY